MKVKLTPAVVLLALTANCAQAQNFINPYDRPIVDLSAQGLPPQIVTSDPTFNPLPTSTAGQLVSGSGYNPYFGSLYGLGTSFIPHIGSSYGSGSGFGFGLARAGFGMGNFGYRTGFGGFGGYGSMGWVIGNFGYRPGWGSLTGGGIASSGRLSSTTVIQTAPSKASGNYYAPSTADPGASGSYYASTPYAGSNYQTFEPRKKNVDKDYWGSSGSPFPKDLNSTPWSNK